MASPPPSPADEVRASTGEKQSFPAPGPGHHDAGSLRTEGTPAAGPSSRRKRVPLAPLPGTGRLAEKAKKLWKMTYNWKMTPETTNRMCRQCQPGRDGMGKGGLPPHAGQAHAGSDSPIEWSLRPGSLSARGTTAVGRLGAAHRPGQAGPGAAGREARVRSGGSEGPAAAVGGGEPQATALREKAAPPPPSPPGPSGGSRAGSTGSRRRLPVRGGGDPFPIAPMREHRYPPPTRPIGGRLPGDGGRERGAPAPRPGRSGALPLSRGPARNVLPPPPPPGQDGRRPRREGPGRAP